ncbi:MAG: NlpC/P60 family protein, partial [Oscillospiraceae bacterium]|nr:NlpC/P60 family protein [Oscillospiraceae bacterium]
MANVRIEASTLSDISTTLNQRTRVNILSESGDFYRIESSGGVQGYISRGLIVYSLDEIAVVTPSEPRREETSAPAVEGESDIVEIARRYLGHRYVLGGTTPSGFDCSGFVYYVVNRSGRTIGRSMSVQINSGTHVARENLSPGDIVFFNNAPGGRLGHN